MIDLSKHIQEGARLELEALEQSMDEGSFLSAQNSAQAMRIDELQAEIGRLRLSVMTWIKKCHDLEEDLAAANAKVEEYRKDAERWKVCLDAEGVSVSIFDCDTGSWKYPDGERLVAAIDAIATGADNAWQIPIYTGVAHDECPPIDAAIAAKEKL